MTTTADAPSLADAVRECAGNPEFVAEFDRLAGTNLSGFGRRSGLDRMIDEATGWERDQCAQFVAFVAEFVWLPKVVALGQETP